MGDTLVQGTSKPGPTQQIPITYLPFTISTPGYYYLVTDLVVTNDAGISITQPATGDITLDMRGHTISTSSYQWNFAIDVEGGPPYYGSGSLPESGSVTIKNGTLSGFPYALRVQFSNHVTINNLTTSSISENGYARAFNISESQNLTVKNCFFTGPTDYAIVELSDVSPAHNVFVNNRFGNTVGQDMLIQYGSSNPAPSVISRIEN